MAQETHSQTVRCPSCTQTLEIQGLRGPSDGGKRQIASLRHGKSAINHLLSIARSDNAAAASK